MIAAPAVRSEDRPSYIVERFDADIAADDAVIAHALRILGARLRAPGACMDSPSLVKDYLRLRIGSLPREVFVVVYLDTQNRVIECVNEFMGTLTQTSVYPREIVKAALSHNAACVILAHNHPSGRAEPSRADEYMTQSLKSALAIVDVRVLDHIVVGASDTVSFAERGLL